MTRPQSEAEYLARMVPPSVAARQPPSAFCAAASASAPRSGAAPCSPLAAAAAAASIQRRVGRRRRRHRRPAPSPSAPTSRTPRRRPPSQTLIDNSQTAEPGLTVKVNTVDHDNFQENINNYLQGKPDDVFTWFAGYRMRFFAAQGLAGDVSDVWKNMQGFTDAFKTASTGDDGKQYFIPHRTTRGPSSTASPSGRSTATRCRRRWTTSPSSPTR